MLCDACWYYSINLHLAGNVFRIWYGQPQGLPWVRSPASYMVRATLAVALGALRTTYPQTSQKLFLAVGKESSQTMLNAPLPPDITVTDRLQMVISEWKGAQNGQP